MTPFSEDYVELEQRTGLGDRRLEYWLESPWAIR